MARKRKQVPVWTYTFGELLAATIEFPGHAINLAESFATVEPIPLELDDQSLLPGAEVVYLGGRKSSAGFVHVHMLPGTWLVYEGMINALEGQLPIFRSAGIEERPETPWRMTWWYHKGYAMYCCTYAISGRSMELSDWIVGRDYVEKCPNSSCECHK